jgi:hypothetical protein
VAVEQTMRWTSIWLLGALLFSLGCGRQAEDLSTPEKAILSLEDAYRAKDIEAAVRCKDFLTEANLMLEEFPKLKERADGKVVTETAKILELAFRKEMKTKGFPDFAGVTARFPKVEPYRENIVVVTEECSYLDGSTTQQRLLVVKVKDGWRVLIPAK